MTVTTIKDGQVGFGRINGYDPAYWRLAGKRGGSWVLEHVKHSSQSRAFPDQFVAWAMVEQIMRNGK